MMKIQYKCEYCGKTYDNEGEAHKCEISHEEWANSEIKIASTPYSFGEDGVPDRIRLRNESGKSYAYERVSV